MTTIRRCLLFLLVTGFLPAAVGMTEHTDADGVTYYSPVQQDDVVMYGTPDCGYCRQARQYFSAQGIDYVEYNINSSSRRLKEFRRLGGRGTPLFVINGRKIRGFNRQAIEAALN